MISFLVKYRLPIILLFFGCQFIWWKTRGNLLMLEEMSFLAWTSFFFLLSLWLFLLLDMIKTPILKKTFWLFSMLILPWLAPAVYLYQRQTSSCSGKTK